MAKTFDQSFSENGKQDQLDVLRKDPGKYDAAKSAWEKGTGIAPTPGIAVKPTGTVADDSGKLYGGWYDNPNAGGKNQRYWGDGVWTDGDEPNAPKDASQVTGYLNDYQNKLMSNGLPETRNMLTDGKEAPAPINRVESYEQLRTEHGVSALEKQLSDLKKAEGDEVAAFRQQRFDERGKPVATNVIAGRIGKEEQAASERLDVITRQKTQLVDELNTKYSMIGQMMEFKGLDYQDAVADYDREFNQNMEMYKLISSEQNAEKDAARSNLQIYMNGITKGNIDYGSLGEDQKVMISKLEAQAGLPVGFTSKLKIDPGSNVVFTTSNNGVTQVGVRAADGSIKVQSYGTPTKGSGTEADFSREAQGEMAQFLGEKSNSYGHVDGDTYKYARQKWVTASGKDPDEFDKLFRGYRDPHNLDQYSLTYSEMDR